MVQFVVQEVLEAEMSELVGFARAENWLIKRAAETGKNNLERLMMKFVALV